MQFKHCRCQQHGCRASAFDTPLQQHTRQMNRRNESDKRDPLWLDAGTCREFGIACGRLQTATARCTVSQALRSWLSEARERTSA